MSVSNRILLVLFVVGGLGLLIGLATDNHSSSSSSSYGSSESVNTPSASTYDISFGSSSKSDEYKAGKRKHANYCREQARWQIEMGHYASAQDWLDKAAEDDRDANR